LRILITGGAGFVGSNLALAARAAFRHAEIVCMDNLYRRGSELNLPRRTAAAIEFHRGDVRRPTEFPKGPFDFLIECSAEPSVLAGQDGSPDCLFETNLVGAYHCLELTGSRSLYGFTKLAAEQLIEEYRAAFGLRTVVNRCGVIAGPWQFGKVDQGVVSLWTLAHHFGRPLRYIGYGGTGKQVRDVLHVEDLCALLIEQIAEFDRWDGWLGNVAGGLANAVSLCELTGLCQKITGKNIEITGEAANRPNDLKIFIADCSRLLERTAWRPKRDPARIIGDIAAWIRDHEASLAAL
jgi:CDP-paratose 2-epimerase